MDAFPSLDSPPPADVRVTGVAGTDQDPEREQFESQFPDLSSEVPSAPAPKPVFNALSQQPYGSSPYPPSQAPPRPASSILPPPAFSNTLPAAEEDTEPIKAWRERQAEEIKKRDARDKERREEMKAKAEQNIDRFYEDYNKEKEKNIRENKENEAKFLEKISEGIAKGTSWERIADLLALENSRSSSLTLQTCVMTDDRIQNYPPLCSRWLRSGTYEGDLAGVEARGRQGARCRGILGAVCSVGR